MLALKHLDGCNGILIAHAVQLAGVVAQLLQARLHLGNHLARRAAANERASHRRHGFNILAVAARILGRILVQL